MIVHPGLMHARPGDLDAGLGEVERRNKGAAAGEKQGEAAESTAVLEDPLTSQIAEEGVNALEQRVLSAQPSKVGLGRIDLQPLGVHGPRV